MTSLYIDKKGIEAKYSDGAIVFYQEEKRTGTVPIAPLRRVFLRGGAKIEASLLGKLGAHDVGLVVLSGRKAEPTCILPRMHQDARRRIGQLHLALNPEFCLTYAKDLVGQKIKTQKCYLESIFKTQLTESRHSLHKAIQIIEELRDKLAMQTSIAQLMGLEGAVAKIYFGALSSVIPASYQFTGRNRRPPRDPVNSLLSLTYTMITAEAVLLSYSWGLDPFVGFYHQIHYGRASLACDLIEKLRPNADDFVLRLIKQKEFRVENFTFSKEGCFLKKEARCVFYAEYELMAKELRKVLNFDVAMLSRKILEMTKELNPLFELKEEESYL